MQENPSSGKPAAEDHILSSPAWRKLVALTDTPAVGAGEQVE